MSVGLGEANSGFHFIEHKHTGDDAASLIFCKGDFDVCGPLPQCWSRSHSSQKTRKIPSPLFIRKVLSIQEKRRKLESAFQTDSSARTFSWSRPGLHKKALTLSTTRFFNFLLLCWLTYRPEASLGETPRLRFHIFKRGN